MKPILTLPSAVLLTVLSTNMYAQNNKPENDFNLQKVYEVLSEEKDEAMALDLVTKQLGETPDNVLALLLRSQLLARNNDFGGALKDVNHALKVNASGKPEVANSMLHWWKGYIYRDMGESQKSAASFKTAYELAKKDDMDNLQNISFSYAQALFDLDDYAGADVIYKEILALDEAAQTAMVGIARNMISRKQYDAALDLLEKCRVYDDDYAEIYHYKMQAYDKLGKTYKAIDAGLDWFDKDEESEVEVILDVLSKRPAYAEACLKSRANRIGDPCRWKAFLCQFLDDTHQYAKAVKAYDDYEAEFGENALIKFYRSDCYCELGLYDRAIADITKAMENEPDWDCYCQRGEYYRLSGDLDSAIADFTAAIEEVPDDFYAYYQRGWCYEMKGDRRKALENYNLGLEMSEDYPFLYLMRGELLLLDGDRKAALEDFETVIQKDTIVKDGSCRHYALHFLGRDKEAEEWMDKIIASDPENPGHYYDRACLYARMGRLDESIAALRMSLEKGCRRFQHIRMDDDLDPIRDKTEFKALLEEYESIHAVFLNEFELSTKAKTIYQASR